MFSFHVLDSSPVWQTHLAGVDVGLNVSVSDGVYVRQLWSSNRRVQKIHKAFNRWLLSWLFAAFLRPQPATRQVCSCLIVWFFEEIKLFAEHLPGKTVLCADMFDVECIGRRR